MSTMVLIHLATSGAIWDHPHSCHYGLLLPYSCKKRSDFLVPRNECRCIRFYYLIFSAPCITLGEGVRVVTFIVLGACLPAAWVQCNSGGPPASTNEAIHDGPYWGQYPSHSHDNCIRTRVLASFTCRMHCGQPQERGEVRTCRRIRWTSSYLPLNLGQHVSVPAINLSQTVLGCELALPTLTLDP